MSAMPHSSETSRQSTPARRRALRTAALLGLLALAFYVGIFFLVHYRHP
jgi:hypothetical protein